MPNIPCGRDARRQETTENPERRRWGTCAISAEGFLSPKPTGTSAPTLDITDFERGNKISGSCFTVLGGAGARLERALINYFLTHTSRGLGGMVAACGRKARDHGVPAGCCGFEDDAYYVSGDMFLIPTAESHAHEPARGEVLDADTLPRWYTAFPLRFREEAARRAATRAASSASTSSTRRRW